MTSLQGFDANEVEPTSGTAGSVLPAGKYEVIIIDDERRPTRDGKNAYLWLEMEVVSGSRKGAHIFDRLNLWHESSQKAREIARANLSAICRAVGVLTPQDTTQLYNKPLVVTVKVRNTTDYGQQNDVVGYEKTSAAKLMTGRQHDFSQDANAGGGDSIPF